MSIDMVKHVLDFCQTYGLKIPLWFILNDLKHAVHEILYEDDFLSKSEFLILWQSVCFPLNFLQDLIHRLVAVMGKVEGQGESWHGHVTAVTVAPEYRRQQLAKKLMNLLEDISDKM